MYPEKTEMSVSGMPRRKNTFEKTFYPKRYFQTDKARGSRKNMQNKTTIKDFLKLWKQ